MIGEIIIGLAFGFFVIVMTFIGWKSMAPSFRWSEYLSAYKIGKLVKHAKDTNIELIWDKRKPFIQEIDEEFEKETKGKKEKEKK